MADQYQLPPTEPTIPVENVPPPSPASGRPKQNRRWLPLLLIGGGVLLFLGNTGVFTSIAWSVLLPLAMLAVGLDLITEGRNRRRIATGALVAAPLLVLLVGGANLFDRGPAVSPPEAGYGGPQPISLEGIERMRVEVKQSAGNLAIQALDDDHDTFTVDGTSQTFRRDGATGIVEVDMSGQHGGKSELLLPPNLPLDMRVEVYGGNAEPIDLRQLELESLQVQVRAGNTEVLLPEQGVMNVEVNSTAGNVEIRVPDELAARVEAASSFGTVDIDDHFEQRDGAWFSPDYSESAPNRATLKLSSTAGSNVDVEVQ